MRVWRGGEGDERFWWVENRLNCSFSPLTFSKFQFWPLKKKKLQNSPLSFATVAVLAPQSKKKITCGTSLRVPRQRRPSQYQFWGPKLLQLQNLGGCFVVFFLGGQNRNFGKVRGLKLQLSLENMRENGEIFQFF